MNQTVIFMLEQSFENYLMRVKVLQYECITPGTIIIQIVKWKKRLLLACVPWENK